MGVKSDEIWKHHLEVDRISWVLEYVFNFRRSWGIVIGFLRGGCLRGGGSWGTVRILAGKIGEP